MTDSLLRRAAFIAAAATAGCAALAGLASVPRVAVGVLAGGAWHLLSLTCLARLLAAWLGPQPSRRRAIAWLLLKLSLYGAAAVLLQSTRLSAVGFGVGFTVVLVAVIAVLAASSQRLSAVR